MKALARRSLGVRQLSFHNHSAETAATSFDWLLLYNDLEIPAELY